MLHVVAGLATCSTSVPTPITSEVDFFGIIMYPSVN